MTKDQLIRKTSARIIERLAHTFANRRGFEGVWQLWILIDDNVMEEDLLPALRSIVKEELEMLLETQKN